MSISSSDIRGRAEATHLARTNLRRAMEVAYAIRHPWYRCQALAAVADAHPQTKAALRLLDDAFRAAGDQEDINRIITVTSWPLHVCVRLAPRVAERKVDELLALAAREPHTLRRGHALCAVLNAVSASPALKARVLAAAVDAATSGHGWRIERILADIARLVREDHPEILPRLLAAHPENRRRRRLVRALQQAESA